MVKKQTTKKYEVIKAVPAKAHTVSGYAALHPDQFKSPAYVHVKFDRHKFGYADSKGNIKFTADPGYKIVTFKGINFVIPH